MHEDKHSKLIGNGVTVSSSKLDKRSLDSRVVADVSDPMNSHQGRFSSLLLTVCVGDDKY